MWNSVWSVASPLSCRVTVVNLQHNELLQVLSVCVWAGRHCEIYKDPCLKMHCQNGGHCESAGLNASCTCPPGYLGEHWCQRTDYRLGLWGNGSAVQWVRGPRDVIFQKETQYNQNRMQKTLKKRQSYHRHKWNQRDIKQSENTKHL